MNLKNLRTTKNLTQKQLAEKMKTTQQTVARWETGKSTLNAYQIKDLCTVLNCTAKQLLGDARGQSEIGQGLYLFPTPGAPYGTLKLTLWDDVKEYPISNSAREDLLVQLSEMHTERADQSDALWLAVWTLDNNYLIINPRYLRKVDLISDDVAEMPSFETEDVYSTLTTWPHSDCMESRTPGVCAALIEQQGLDAVQSSLLELCVTLNDGVELRADLTEATAHSLWELTTLDQTNERVCFVELEDEGFERVSFVNVAQIAMIELPAAHFRNLMEGAEPSDESLS